MWLQLLLLCSVSPCSFLPLTLILPLYFIHHGHFAPSPVNSQCCALRRLLRLPRLSGRRCLPWLEGGEEQSTPPGTWHPSLLHRDSDFRLYRLSLGKLTSSYNFNYLVPIPAKCSLQGTLLHWLLDLCCKPLRGSSTYCSMGMNSSTTKTHSFLHNPKLS